MQKTINIEPYLCEAVNIKTGSFTLVFEDRKKKIQVNLDNWWIEILAEQLHRVLNENQKKLDCLKRAMQG